MEVDRGGFGVTEGSACTGMTNNQLQIERSKSCCVRDAMMVISEVILSR